MSATGVGARLAKRLMRGLMSVLFRVQVTGDQSVFVNERTLIVANHESLLDGFLLALFLPIEATFVVHTVVTKSALFRFLLRFAAHLSQDRHRRPAAPLDRDADAVERQAAPAPGR